jgi:hypothetical protein
MKLTAIDRDEFRALALNVWSVLLGEIIEI